MTDLFADTLTKRFFLAFKHMKAPINSVADCAREAIKLIEKGWTDVEPAIDAAGKVCPCYGPTAVAWTLLGSIAALGSTAKEDKIKLQLIGRIKAFMPRGTTLVQANTSKPAAIGWLSKGLDCPSKPSLG